MKLATTTGSARADDEVPQTGHPVPVCLDRRTVFLWWGQDGLGNDRLATSGGRLVLTASEAGLEALAAARGWTATADEVTDEQDSRDHEAVVIDVDEVRAWLSHAGTAVPLAAALNVWNFATDVAYSFGRVRADRGYWADRAYDKLFAANVPWAVGRASYRPRWLRQELLALRRVEGEAVGLMRWALTALPATG